MVGSPNSTLRGQRGWRQADDSYLDHGTLPLPSCNFLKTRIRLTGLTVGHLDLSDLERGQAIALLQGIVDRLLPDLAGLRGYKANRQIKAHWPIIA